MLFKRIILLMGVGLIFAHVNVAYAQPRTIQRATYTQTKNVSLKNIFVPSKTQTTSPRKITNVKTDVKTVPAIDFDIDNDGYRGFRYYGNDCDDRNAAIHPNATEIWYDGVDQNCDKANDYDQDGDGYIMDPDHSRPEGTPLDCDDTDASVHPTARGNGNCPGGNSQNIPTTDSENACLTVGDSLFYAYPTSGADRGRAYKVAFLKKSSLHSMENGWTELTYSGGKISVAIQDSGRNVWLSGGKVQNNLQVWNTSGVYLEPTTVSKHFVTYSCPAS